MGIKQWQLLSLLTVLRAKLQGIIKGILQMNYIPPVQLCLEKGSIRDTCLMEQAAEITALSSATSGTNWQAGRQEAEVTQVTPGQLDPPGSQPAPSPGGASEEQAEPGWQRMLQDSPITIPRAVVLSTSDPG